MHCKVISIQKLNAIDKIHIRLFISQHIADNCIINIFMNRVHKSEKTTGNVVKIIICKYIKIVLFLT